MPELGIDGFAVHSKVFSENELEAMRVEADKLQKECRSACIRHLRSKSSDFDALANDRRLLRLLPSDLVPVRSILFDKNPKENWPVAWHQDLTIAVQSKRIVDGYGPWSTKDGIPHVQPPVSFLETMTTLRIHLDETPESNGALRVIPGSHLLGRLNPEEIGLQASKPESICECHPGDILQMAPLLLHASSRSSSPSRRRVIHFEYASPSGLGSELRFHES